jgi:hypothetical protein
MRKLRTRPYAVPHVYLRAAIVPSSRAARLFEHLPDAAAAHAEMVRMTRCDRLSFVDCAGPVLERPTLKRDGLSESRCSLRSGELGGR